MPRLSSGGAAYYSRISDFIFFFSSYRNVF